jgi:cytoskeleton protein RodZ
MNNNEHPNNNDTDKPSLGRVLAGAREKQGLTQQQVAQRLRLRVSSIQALEADETEKDVSITFTKGYVRLYAKLLGLEVEPLMQAFETLNGQNGQQPAKLQSFSRRVAREANDSRWNLVTYIIAALVIGSVVLWWVDQSDFSLSSSVGTDTTQNYEQTGEVQNAEDTQQAELDLLEQTPINGREDTVSSFDSPDVLPTELDSLSNGEPAVAPPVLEEEIRNLATADETDQEQIPLVNPPSSSSLSFAADLPYIVNADGTVDITFTFADDCWVSVKDANGETVAIGVKVKGRVMEVSGIPPLEVILGAPGVVDINFGGQDVDLSQFPVARSANFQLPLQGE